MSISRKRLSLIPEERNSARNLDLRISYASDIENFDVSKLVYLDETGFNLHTSSKYGYSEKNTKAYLTVPANKGINISLMCAINKDNVIGFEIIDGAFNGDIFKTYTDNHLVPFFNANRDSILILDNCRFHHRHDVIRLLRQFNIGYRFLPPYSPQLNPIEEFFASVKGRYNMVRPRPSSRSDLKRVLENILRTIDYSLEPLFLKAKRFLELALSRRPFI